MQRKVNDNGMPPGHPNPEVPAGVAESVAIAASDMAYEESERAKRMGLNCFTKKAPWFTGGNDENQS